MGEVDVHGARKRVGHHEGRLAEVVLRHVGADAAVEVAVAREHARELGLGGDGLQGGQDVARVADAGHAAKAAGEEAQLAERRDEARSLEQARSGMAARGEDALDPRPGGEPALAGLLGREAGGHHHRRVGRRGAARDGGNGKRALAHRVGGAVCAGDLPGAREVDAVALGRLLEASLEAGGRRAVVRARRSGEREFHLGEVELDDAGVVAARALAKDALHAGVGLDEGHIGVGTTGKAQVVEDVVVDREERTRGTVLGRHVGHAGALGHRERGDAVAEGLDEAAHDALGAQTLGHREGEVHRRDAVAEPAREVQAHHLGNAQADGLAERRSLGLDAAHAPAEHADAVGRGRVRVGAHDGVEAGELARALPEGVGGDYLAEALDVELMADAASGRDDLHVVEGVARPLEEGEALAVAPGLDLEVLGRSLGAARDVGRDRVVDDERARNLGVHAARVSPAPDHGVAHRGEVDEHGHAGEVLEEHARRHELDLLAGGAGLARLEHAGGLAHGVGIRGGATHHVLEQRHEAGGELGRPRDCGHVDDAARDAARRELAPLTCLGNGPLKLCLTHDSPVSPDAARARGRCVQGARSPPRWT